MTKHSLLIVAFGALALLGPSRAAAQSDPDTAALIGGGLGILGAGLALDGLVFAFGDESLFTGSNPEGGFALVLPPTFVAGGLQLTAAGIALEAGVDSDAALMIGGGVNLAAAAALTVTAILVGLDPGACVGNLCGAEAGGILGMHAGASLLMGGLTMIVAGMD